MGGFFGLFDYSRPGPGIEKDAPAKPRIVVFFEIIGRKFWDLVKLNLLFFLFNIPATFIGIYLSLALFPNMKLYPNDYVNLALRVILGTFVLCIPILTVGPAQAGFTYVLRNYAREEHAFVWGDFKEHALKNFKEGLMISVIDFFVFIIIGISVSWYVSRENPGMIMTVSIGLQILTLLLYLMMHMYIYPMLVTFKLTVGQIYKNAVIFALIKFIPNLLILILCFVIVFVSMYSTIIGIVLLPLVTFSLIGFISNFFVYPTLKKFMIDRVPEQEGNK